MKVHSDKRRKPRYYVTEGDGLNEQVVYEGDDATEVIQWAVDEMEERMLAKK